MSMEQDKLKSILTHNQFKVWRNTEEIKLSFSENVLLAYFREFSEKVKPNTL